MIHYKVDSTNSGKSFAFTVTKCTVTDMPNQALTLEFYVIFLISHIYITDVLCISYIIIIFLLFPPLLLNISIRQTVLPAPLTLHIRNTYAPPLDSETGWVDWRLLVED